MQQPIERALRRGQRTWVRPPPLSGSEWAERHFYLSAESSYVEQRWRSMPPQVVLLDVMCSDAVRDVTLMKSARVGYTKMLLACIGYFAQHRRRNQIVWQPTDEDADDFVKTELDTMLRDVRALQEVMPAFTRRDKSNTLRQKQFLGSLLHIRGGKAAKNYRRLSADVGFLDELDGFDTDIEKEGSPDRLSAKRLEGATFPKHIAGSTPKLKHLSMIEARCEQADRRYRWHVPCPECDTLHALTWGGMKYDPADPESVRQLCPECGALYSQAQYLEVWTRGQWIDQAGGRVLPGARFVDADGQAIEAPRSVAFHIWTACISMARWPDLVREYLAALAKKIAGDTSPIKTFTNTTLGESYEEEVERGDAGALQRRAEDYALGCCPSGVLILVAGVDVQDNRFEVSVWGLGRGLESWLVQHIELHANPADESDWNKLDAFLLSRFAHESGQTLGLDAVAIDSGGHFTHQVYQFCRMREARRVFAVKGDSLPGKPVKARSSVQDVTYRGKTIKNGVRLWFVGTDTAKDLLHGRLKLDEPGPGYVHFSKELPAHYFTKLTAEARVLVKTATGQVWRWVRRERRNEPLDCAVYAIFAAHMLGLDVYTEKMWDRLAERVNPRQGDLLAQAPQSAPPEQQEREPEPVTPAATSKAVPRTPRRGGFVQGWSIGVNR